MPHISSFWHAAAQLSGQIDFSQSVFHHRGHVAQLSTDKLREMGIKATHLRLLRRKRSANPSTDDPGPPLRE